MAARGGRNNLVARKIIDGLIDISGERSPLKTSTNLISQLNVLIAELEASGDYEEVINLVMELRHDRHDEQDNVADFNRLIDVAEEKIHGKKIDLEMLDAEVRRSLNGMECYVYGFIVHYFVVNGIMSGYEAVSNICSELIDGMGMAFALVCEAPTCLIRIVVGNAVSGFWQVYSEVLLHRLIFGRINWFSDYMDEYNHEDDENNHSNGNVVKRGITRLYKFRREYGKPDGIKLSVTFDALNRISGKHIALFLSFLRDMVREHIGLKILSWKKVDSEARDKLWDEITRYFDVDLTVIKLVMNRLGQLLRNFIRKLRQTYILPNQNTLSKLNEVSAKYSAILQAEEWVNFVKYTATDEYKVRKREVMQEEWEVELHTRESVGCTRGKLQSMSTQLTPPNVSPVDINPINSSADEEGGTKIHRCKNDTSIQKSNGLATLEKEMETRVSNRTSPCETVKSVGSKKMTRSIRKDSSFVCSGIANSLLLFRHSKLITIFGAVVKPSLDERSTLWLSCSWICDALALSVVISVVTGFVLLISFHRWGVKLRWEVISGWGQPMGSVDVVSGWGQWMWSATVITFRGKVSSAFNWFSSEISLARSAVQRPAQAQP
nr:hypothetical protein [Tanacetum cinerariifolium]